MRKTLLIVALGGFVTLGLSNAGAATYVDTQYPVPFLDQDPAGNIFGVYWDGLFDLRPYGFNPATEMVSMAYASFTFYNTSGASQTVSIQVDGDPVVDGSLLDGAITPVEFSLFGDAVGYLNFGSLPFYEPGTVPFSVELLLQGGDPLQVTLQSAELTAVTGDGSPAVPDSGSTLALLSLGILGLGAAKRSLICR